MEIQWPLVFFTLFVGLGCGIFAGSAILTEWYGKVRQIRTHSSIIAIVALAIGGLSSTLHLGHPERIFGALAHPTSGIFMESAMIFLLGLTILVYLLALRRNAADRTVKIIATAGAVLAVGLACVSGDTYVMAARPAWNTLALPALYMVSSAVMGCFGLGMLLTGAEKFVKTAGTAGTAAETAATTETTEATETAAAAIMVKRAALSALAVQALFMIIYLVHIAMAPYPDTTRSLTRVLAGNLAPLFWGGMVLLGLVVPAVLIRKSGIKEIENMSTFRLAALSLISVLIGSVAFRAWMFLIGSSVRQFF